ncbi:MAG TPA: hypothetical protein VHC97_10550 [Thermoanaerobaculia bacterium]|nr:hypothetical protein [Thermoanaerobaculia bacterium]
MSKAQAIGNGMKGFRTLVMSLALGTLMLAGAALPAQAQGRAGWGTDNCYYVPGAFGWDLVGCRLYFGDARQGTLYYLDAINATFYALPTTGDPNRYASLTPRELRSRGRVINLMPQGGYGVPPSDLYGLYGAPSTGGSRRECAGSHCWSDKDWVDSWVKSFKNPYQD